METTMADDARHLLDGVFLEQDSLYTRENHLLTIKQQVQQFRPNRIAVDSLSALERVSSLKSFREFVIGLTSFIKHKETAGLFTATAAGLRLEHLPGRSVRVRQMPTLSPEGGLPIGMQVVGRPFDDMLESFSTLAYLAACTERVRLGTLVAAVTHRSVPLLAKTVATLPPASRAKPSLTNIAWPISGASPAWRRRSRHSRQTRAR